MHGGTVSATSGGIGLGSEFSLRLPSVRRPEGGKIDALAATGTRPRKARRILVVDDVARRIRREDWGRDILIIAVSGYGQDDDRNRARESGIDHHLTKPVEFDALAQLFSGSHSA